MTLNDLLENRVVHLTKHGPLRSFLEAKFLEQGLELVVDLEVGTQRAMVNMVAGGAGVGIVDPDIISNLDGQLVASCPMSPPLVWEMAIVSLKNNLISAITKSFIGCLDREAPE